MAINYKNNYWQAYNNRALCEIMKKDFIPAITDLTKTIQLNSDCASAYYLRGLAKTELGREGCSDFYDAFSRGYQNAEIALRRYCK